MITVSYDKVKERETELIRYNGFLPMDILKYINLVERNNYLKSVGKFEEIQKLNSKYRINYSKQGKEYRNTILRKWINDNPQFKDLVIQI